MRLAIRIADAGVLTVCFAEDESAIDGRTLVIYAKDTVRSIEFTPDGNTLAVGGEHGAIDLLSLQTRKWKEPIVHSGNVNIRSLRFADRGKTLLAASSAGGIHLWDTETNEMIYSIDVDLNVTDIYFTLSEETIIVAGKAEFERGELRVHRLATRLDRQNRVSNRLIPE